MPVHWIVNVADVIAGKIGTKPVLYVVVTGGGAAGAGPAHRIIPEGPKVAVLKTLPEICRGSVYCLNAV